MKFFSRVWEDLLGLFYPRLCLACHENSPAREEWLCLECQFRLPYTNYHLDRDNPFTERFWGRVPLESGAALFHFLKKGRAQSLIHHLKYAGKPEVGLLLGRQYGRMLRESPHFHTVDGIVPVPLHPRKQHQRGYNQSARFAAGLAEAMDRPWIKHALIRTTYTETQTRKSRLERFENVRHAFAIREPEKLTGKHILLVDDVLTTGATLEACGLQILNLQGCRLSMATIGIAQG